MNLEHSAVRKKQSQVLDLVKSGNSRLEATEMCMWRKMIRASWTERKINLEVLTTSEQGNGNEENQIYWIYLQP